MSMKGITIFITGGSRGIGLAIAKRCAREGANIAIAAKTAEPHPNLPGTIYTAAQEIEQLGAKALPLIWFFLFYFNIVLIYSFILTLQFYEKLSFFFIFFYLHYFLFTFFYFTLFLQIFFDFYNK